MSATAHCSNPRTLVASIAGGPARHFRVQIMPPGESSWRLFAKFQSGEVASECAQQLASQGIASRVVSVRIFPTAA